MSDNKHARIPFGDDENGEFGKSLESFGAENIGGGEVKVKKKKTSRKISDALHYTILAVCAAVFIVCVILIIGNLKDKERGEEIYGDAASDFIPVTLENTTGDETAGDPALLTPYERILAAMSGGDPEIEQNAYNMDLASVKATLSSMKQLNPDVVGWIYVEDTKISYPLMQSSKGDNEYYLTHAYNGEYLAVGSIYMVSECDVKLDNNFNTLIYGHNVVNGSMFHDVMKFFDEEFFNSKYIYIYTLDGAYIYQPFSIYETKSSYNYIQTLFGSENEYLEFASEMKNNSTIPSPLSIERGDTMITLSTCTGTGLISDARYSLHAKLIAFAE